MGRLRYIGEDERFRHNRGLFSKGVVDYGFRYTEDEPVVCKCFGCGKILSPTEKLFSDYCFSHNDIPLTGRNKNCPDTPARK